MDVSDFPGDFWLGIDQTIDSQQDPSSRSWNDETIKSSKAVEDPIYLFRQFISAVSSDVLEDIKPRSEFSASVQDLCVKAPSVAKYLVHEILNHSGNESQGSKESGSGTNSKQPSKRRKQLDSTYRLPKSSKTQPHFSKDEAEDSDTAVEGHSLVGYDSVTCQPGHNNMAINQISQSLATEKPQPLQECEGDIPEIIVKQALQEGVQGQSATHDSEPTLHPLEATYSSNTAVGDTVHKQPSMHFDELTEDSLTTHRPLFQSKAEQRKTSDAQAASAPSLSHGTDPHESTLSGRYPSTPVPQIGRGFQSPLSDDETVTPHTALFTPTINREVLLPLTEDDRTASPADKVEMTFPEGVPSSPYSTAQQVELYMTASTHARPVNEEQPLPYQDRQLMPPPFSCCGGTYTSQYDRPSTSSHIQDDQTPGSTIEGSFKYPQRIAT